MAKRKALGRGLGAFFPDYEDENAQKQSKEERGEDSTNPYVREREDAVNIVLHVPVGSVRPNPNQPRKDFDELKLQELAGSIQQHGLIQPITVRRIGGDRYELVSGERRLRATKMAGIETIPAYVREVADNDSIAFALIENVQREELNPIEVALAYQQLIEECAFTQEQVATKVGKNRTTVTNMLRLLNLPAAIQAALKQRQISTGHARSLLSVEDESTQDKLLDKTIEEGWSVRQVEEAVRRLGKPSKKKKSPKQPVNEDEIHLNDISKRLRSKLSTKVQLKTKKKGGEIRIEYYSDEDLERLLSMFESL